MGLSRVFYAGGGDTSPAPSRWCWKAKPGGRLPPQIPDKNILTRYLILLILFMLEIFDGFINAVASEFHIPFKKTEDGEYSAMVEFEGGRHQKVLVTFDKDDQGDPMINYYSVICELKEPAPELFREALMLNTTLTYGAIALMEDDSLIMHQATFLKDLDPQRFIKSFLYVAAKADELEEQLTGLDIA